MAEIEKCPKCGEELKQGFLRAPRGLYWEYKNAKWQRYTSWWSSRVEAWRCDKCNLVLFSAKDRDLIRW